VNPQLQACLRSEPAAPSPDILSPFFHFDGTRLVARSPTSPPHLTKLFLTAIFSFLSIKCPPSFSFLFCWSSRYPTYARTIVFPWRILWLMFPSCFFSGIESPPVPGPSPSPLFLFHLFTWAFGVPSYISRVPVGVIFDVLLPVPPPLFVSELYPSLPGREAPLGGLTRFYLQTSNYPFFTPFFFYRLPFLPAEADLSESWVHKFIFSSPHLPSPILFLI